MVQLHEISQNLLMILIINSLIYQELKISNEIF